MDARLVKVKYLHMVFLLWQKLHEGWPTKARETPHVKLEYTNLRFSKLVELYGMFI